MLCDENIEFDNDSMLLALKNPYADYSIKKKYQK
jgi:hypothetical protein